MEDNNEVNREKVDKFFSKETTKIDFDNLDLKKSDTKSRLSDLKKQLSKEPALPVVKKQAKKNKKNATGDDSQADNSTTLLQVAGNQGVTKSRKLEYPKDLSVDQIAFIDLMIPMQFNVSDICAEVGINRRTYYRWLDENVAFKQAYDDAREYIIDKAEQVLMRAMDGADAKTAQFILKALSWRYKDKIDITSNGQTVGSTINIINPKIMRNGEED